MICMNSRLFPSGKRTGLVSSSSLMTQHTAEAMPMTKMTAMPMPRAVSTRLDTPMKGQMPRN